MKLILRAFILLFFLLIGISLINAADFQKGDPSSNFQTKYGYGENLRGWMNLTLSNYPVDTIATFNGFNTTLKQLLVSSGVNYKCSTLSCDKEYAVIGEGNPAKSLQLGAEGNQIIALKITEQRVEEVTKFEMALNLDASESCNPPLKIDAFNDGTIDWVYGKPANSFCGAKSYGCFGNSTLLASAALGFDNLFCGEFRINSAPGLLVGADLALVSGSGSTQFEFSVVGGEGDLGCVGTLTGNGTVSCEINMTIDNLADITVCINQRNNFGAQYKIYYEDNNPCGEYSGAGGSTAGDFSIFVQKKNYAAPVNYEYNDSLDLIMSTAIDEGIVDAYGAGKNCSNGCIVPFKIISGQNQNLNINKLEVQYNQIKSSNLIYNAAEQPALLSTNNFAKISLDNSGFNVPTSSGDYNLSLSFGENEVMKISFGVLALPVALSLIPSVAPAAIETRFRIIYRGNATSFVWRFGDNTTLETKVPYTNHRYANTGNYNISLTLKNNLGEINATFPVSSVSPKDYLNSTILGCLEKINKLEAQINSFPSGAKNPAETMLNLTRIETEVMKAKADYEAAGSDDSKYIAIANSLNAIDIPDRINTSQKSSGRFIMNPEIIANNDFSSIAGESYSADTSKNKEAIYSWFMENINVNAELQTYSAYYSDSETALFSLLVLKINPKKTLDKIYIVAKNAARISGAQAVAGTSGVYSMNDLAERIQKGVDVVFSGQVSMSDLPVYFLPSSSRLSIREDVSACNFNKICEKELGEDSKNCAGDCKPVGKAWLFFSFGLIVLLCLYIFLQEWYKRRYEDYLFKEKNDLYNLIQFIQNAEKKGMGEEEIFEKLRVQGWDKERIAYAYKKYKGMRTGMWEIPVFGFIEKIKLKKKLDEREKQSSQNKQNPPMPLARNPRATFLQKGPITPSQLKTSFNPMSSVRTNTAQRSLQPSQGVQNPPVLKTAIKPNPQPNQPPINPLTQKPINNGQKDLEKKEDNPNNTGNK